MILTGPDIQPLGASFRVEGAELSTRTTVDVAVLELPTASTAKYRTTVVPSAETATAPEYGSVGADPSVL